MKPKKPTLPLDEANWTRELVDEYIAGTSDVTDNFLLKFFGWTQNELWHIFGVVEHMFEKKSKYWPTWGRPGMKRYPGGQGSAAAKAELLLTKNDVWNNAHDTNHLLWRRFGKNKERPSWFHHTHLPIPGSTNKDAVSLLLKWVWQKKAHNLAKEERELAMLSESPTPSARKRPRSNSASTNASGGTPTRQLFSLNLAAESPADSAANRAEQPTGALDECEIAVVTLEWLDEDQYKLSRDSFRHGYPRYQTDGTLDLAKMKNGLHIEAGTSLYVVDTGTGEIRQEIRKDSALEKDARNAWRLRGVIDFLAADPQRREAIPVYLRVGSSFLFDMEFEGRVSNGRPDDKLKEKHGYALNQFLLGSPALLDESSTSSGRSPSKKPRLSLAPRREHPRQTPTRKQRAKQPSPADDDALNNESSAHDDSSSNESSADDESSKDDSFARFDDEDTVMEENENIGHLNEVDVTPRPLPSLIADASAAAPRTPTQAISGEKDDTPQTVIHVLPPEPVNGGPPANGGSESSDEVPLASGSAVAPIFPRTEAEEEDVRLLREALDRKKTAGLEFPDMVYPEDLGNLAAQSGELNPEPSISLEDLKVNVKFFKDLSELPWAVNRTRKADTDGSTDEPIADTDELMGETDGEDGASANTDIGAHDQLDRDFFRQVCAFAGFNPAEYLPTVRVRLPGLSKEESLYIWQVYALCWTMKQLAKCESLSVLALGVGLGKTAVALALIRMQALFQRMYTDPSHERLGYPLLAEQPGWQDKYRGQHSLSTLTGGEKPKVRSGPTLLVLPSAIVETNWMGEVSKFIARNASQPNLWVFVLVEGEDAQRSKRKTWPTEFLDAWQKIAFSESSSSARVGCLPSETELVEYFGEKRVESFKKNGIYPHELLEPPEDPDQRAPTWQANYVVFTRSSTYHKAIRTADFQKKTKNEISMSDDADVLRELGPTWASNIKEVHNVAFNCKFSLVVVDESQQNKKAKTNFWTMAYSIPGDPAFVALSATPWDKPDGMEPLLMCKDARYFEVAEKRNRHVRTIKHFYDLKSWVVGDEFDDSPPTEAEKKAGITKLAPTIIWKNPNMEQRDKDFIIARAWWTIKDDARLITNWMARATSHSEVDKAHREKSAVADPAATAAHARAAAKRAEKLKEVQDAIGRLTSFWKRMIISWASDIQWGFPQDDFKPLPAAPKPPHHAFKVTFDHAPDAAAVLQPWYDRLLEKIKEGTLPFMTAAGKLDIFTTIPELLIWIRDNPAVRAKWGQKDAMNSDNLQWTPEDPLYKMMPEFDKTPLARNFFEIITRLHEQANGYEDGRRKVVQVAWKPFIAMVFQMWTHWLCETKNHGPWEKGAICFASTFGSTVKQKKELAQFSEFREDAYNHHPWLLIATARSIPFGVNLASADAIVVLDLAWLWSELVQSCGRISRNKRVQLSEKTEVYLLNGQTEGVVWNEWKCLRNSSQSSLRKKLEARADSNRDDDDDDDELYA